MVYLRDMVDGTKDLIFRDVCSDDRLFKDSLFKYKPVNEYTKELLENNEFYFSSPQQLNDPKDCYVNFVYKGSEDEFIAHMVKKGILVHPTLENWLSNSTKTVDGKYLYQKREQTNKVRVFCLSGLYNETLMWSHYAESHKGICIEFKTYNVPNGAFLNSDSLIPHFKNGNNFIIYKVKYEEEFPKEVNLLNENEWERTSNFIITKNASWEYEDEYRIVLPTSEFNGDNYTIKFDKRALKSIIFGTNIDKIKIREIYNIIDKNYLKKGISIDFYSMKFENYELKREKIESIEDFLNSQ